ncbi:ABC transporter permease [Streptomyces tremellae]|uniref:ABC transporter permease subunit n=1 Tax=Streptomyces tremellae TaxID=1124239 RepID=A0ABP7FC24_9ACTN
MAALTSTADGAGTAPVASPQGGAPAARRRAGARRGRPRVWRGAVLGLAGVDFVVPLVASFVFTVHVPGQGVDFDAYTGILSADGFGRSLLLSLGLAAATIALSLLLVVPAMVAVRLGAPRLRPVVEIVCMLPLVVPPIALVSGVQSALRWGPDHLATTPLYQTFIAVQNPSFPLVLVFAYVVLALPFVYRSLDAGLRAVDLTTLVEAARNCGASMAATVWRVVLPNLRSSLAGAAFLTLALVLGEYTIAALLGYEPFAVWIVTISGDQAQMSVAVSLLSLLIAWALLLVLSRAGARADTGAAAPGAAAEPPAPRARTAPASGAAPLPATSAKE